jgi:hypothetical protein
MARSGRFLVLVWAMTLACGCGREPAAAAPRAGGEVVEGAGEIPRAAGEPRVAEPRPGEGDVRPVIEALGDEGAVVVVLRPRHWSALLGAVAPWMAELPPSLAMLAEALGEPRQLFELLARPLNLPAGSITLDGWDTSRPVVASLGEVPYDGPPGAVTPQLPALDGWMPPVRHQLWLPATDPAVLTASLGATLERVATPYSALVEGREGARAVKGDDVVIAVLPGGDAVRVVVFQAAVGRDEAARLEHMRERLDVEDRASSRIPAPSLLTRPDAVVSGWVRPWRLRPLAAWSGSVELTEALAEVDAEHRAMLLARGMQIVLATELLMTDEGAELDDVAVSLVVDEEVLRLHSAMSLTPEGEAIMEAASKGAGETYMAAVDDAWIDVALRADARAMLEATEPPPALGAGSRTVELARALSEGGGLALVYMGLRHPFGMLRVVEQQAKTERLPLPIDTLPTAVQLVWRGQDGDVPRVALWLQWPAAYLDRPLAGMVPLAKREPGFESLRMDTLAPYGRPVTVFGLGGESASSFDTSKGDGFAGMVRARVSLARIGADVAKRDPERGAMLAAAGEVRVTIDRRGGALVGELAWAPGGGELEAKAVPVAEGERGAVPGGSAVGEGTRCLATAGRGAADGLDALAVVAEDQLATVAGNTLLEIEASLRCAAGEPGTAEAAAGLRRLVVRLATDVMVARGQDAAARKLRREQCDASGDASICEIAGSRARE